MKYNVKIVWTNYDAMNPFATYAEARAFAEKAAVSQVLYRDAKEIWIEGPLTMERVSRTSLARDLEGLRIAKERAKPKSKAWYAADSEIERLSKVLFGKGITLDLDNEVES